jgi:hypothetical protein
MPAGASRAACWLHDAGGVGDPVVEDADPVGKEVVDA